MLDPIFKKDHRIVSSFQIFMRQLPPICTRTVTYTGEYSCESHYHDYPQLWYCHAGSYTHKTEFGDFLCIPGSLLIIPPGVLHYYNIPVTGGITLTQMDMPFDYLSGVDFESVPNTAMLLFLPPFLRHLGLESKMFFVLSKESRVAFEQLMCVFADSEENESAKRLALEQCLSLPEFTPSQAVRGKAAALARKRLYPVLRVLSYIHANYAQKITAEALCKVSLLCQTNLFSFIKQYLGISYAVYLTMIRTYRVDGALKHTDYSLAYISDMCGFANCSHMDKCYQKYVGCLPKTARANQKEHQRQFGKVRITQEYFLNDFYK